MKIYASIIALFLLSSVHAQTAKTVPYELNTRIAIQSLRLSTIAENATNNEIIPSIGDIRESVVCLHLNPANDYELMVNNTLFFTITSEQIRERMEASEPTSPVILVSTTSLMSEE